MILIKLKLNDMAKKRKYKFVAKPISSLVKYEENISKQNNNLPIEEEFTIDNTFNLSDLNLSELTNGISRSINKGFKLFLFTQERENKKITLKIEHIKLLQSTLMETKKLGKDILDLKAEHLISEETLRYLKIGKKIELRQSIELLIEQHKTRLNEERIKREKQQIELLNLKADLALKEAQAVLLKSKSDEQKEHAEFMKKVNESFINLPSSAKLIMFHDFINRHKKITDTSDIKDFDFEDFLKDMAKKYYQEGLNQFQAKTTSSQAQADHDRWRTDKKTGKI